MVQTRIKTLIMKEKFLIIAMVLICLGLSLMTSSIVAAQSEGDFAVPLTDPAKRGKLKAHINYGSITVKGTARKDVLVKYAPAEENNEGDEDDNDQDDEGQGKNKSKEGLRKIGGSGMDLEVTENNNSIVVQSDSWNNKLNITIEVPSGFDLEVSTYNDGDLMVTNVQGDCELTNYNGEITALNISGSVIATTYNGDVKVTFDKISADAPMSFSTFNGDIDITFPATLKATLKMKTEQGEIYTGFDVVIKSTGPIQKKDTRSGVYKVVVDEWKRGDVNGGGPEITMKNYNGDIYVRKK
jgi:DUF4097 and DUF4098 domain-containing protein YvlB